MPVPALTNQHIEAATLNGFVAKCIASTLAATVDQVTSRMDFLQQTQHKIHDSLESNDAVPKLHDGTYLGEEIEAISAIASSVRQDMKSISDFAKRVESFVNMPSNDVDRSMIDVNTCIEEVV